MYYPFLRAKQFELIALRELVDLCASSQKVLPVIEPVRKNTSSLLRTLREYDKKNVTSMLITNSQYGEVQTDAWQPGSPLIKKVIDDLGNTSMCIPTFQIRYKTDFSSIRTFLREYNGRDVAIIHYAIFDDVPGLLVDYTAHGNVRYNCFVDSYTSVAYRNQFSGFGPVLLQDGFNKKRKNELYPEDEYFSDLYSTYTAQYGGFGDYLIVGDEWTESAGPAYTIAIHLTYKKSGDDSIWIRHFLSHSDQDNPANPAGKFGEAINKASAWMNAEGYNTLPYSGCIEFLSLHASGQYPGLGVAKKLSMKHHIELITTLI